MLRLMAGVLSILGAPAQDDLITQFGRETIPNRRETIVQKIQSRALAADVDRLEPFLSSPDRSVRTQAAVAMYGAAPAKAMEAIVAELSRQEAHPNDARSNQYRAFELLKRLKDPRALPGLVRVVARGERTAALDAGMVIRELGAEPVKLELQALVQDTTLPWARLGAAQALWDADRATALTGMKRAWVEVRALPSHERWTAAHALAQAGAAELEPEYLAMLQETDTNLVRYGLLGLARIKQPTTAPEVLKVVERGRPETKANALLALSAMGEPRSLEAARQLLRAHPPTPGEIADVKREMEFGTLKDEVTAPVKAEWLALLSRAGKLTRAAQSIVQAKQECEHWGGEEPYDHERAEEIRQGYLTSCTAAVRKAAAVVRKNRRDMAARTAAQGLLDLLAGSTEVDTADLEAALR